jgi:hypothetical protein
MSNPTQQNILGACLAPSVYEKGGGYGQKGVDFQRYWAISRIVELATADEPDFLILFESLQDIAEFDHAQAPTNAKIYQLKTKDTGEWTWKALTALPIQSRKKRNSDEPTTPKAFVESPVGKIVCSLVELDPLTAEGHFVSNVGSNAGLENGSTAGTLCVCRFSELSQELRDQIVPELQKLRKTVSLDDIHIDKTELSLEDPDTHVTGKIHNYLQIVAPRHAGQARSFSDSLFAVLSKRGRRTDPPKDFGELVRTRGFSKSEFKEALDALKSRPDEQALITTWLAYLQDDGMPLTQLTKLQIRLARLVEERLKTGKPDSSPYQSAAKDWIASNPPDDNILEFVLNGARALAAHFPTASQDHLQAEIVLEGIHQCLSQI